MISEKTLTIIITAHDEGELSGLSVNSMLKAAEKLSEIGVKYDVLVNIDRGDKKTIDYFKKLKIRNITINYSDYGDPGLARNAVIKKAKGKYLALIDADDAVSENWLIEAMKKVVNEEKMLLVHPEAELRYSNEGFLSLDMRANLNNLWEDTLALILGNRWCSIVVGRREIFLNNSYSASTNGFGYEDYYFNCLTVYNGVGQMIVPGTTVFCLQKKNSITKKTHKNNGVLPYLKLFDYKFLQKQMAKNGLTKNNLKREEIDVPDYILSQFKAFSKDKGSLSEMIQEIKKIKINKNDIHECVNIGVLFCEMISKVRLKKNIGKLCLVNNLVDYYENKIEKNDLVIMLGDDNNLPSTNNVLDFQRFFGGTPFWVRDAIMVKIMIEFGIKKISICNNEFVQEWVDKYKNFMMKNNIEINGVL